MGVKIKRIMLLISTAVLIAVVFCACSQKDRGDFSGKRIGVLTGSVFDEVAKKYIEDPEISYFNSNADIAMALDKGKIDGYVNDEPVWRLLCSEYPDQICKSIFSQEEYGFIFRKNDEKSAAICGQISEYIKKIKADGTLKEIDGIWFGDDESKMKIDFSFTGENGTLTMATTTDIGAPFAYMIGGDFAGYDIDVAARFCKEYGYRLEIVNTTFAGMLASVTSGKSDFGGACITINDERKETMLFSEPDYIGGNVLVCREQEKNGITSREQLADLAGDEVSDGGENGFFIRLKDSFYKTFIRESRYLLFLSGLGTTVLIALLSIVLGSLLGYAVYLCYYHGGKIYCAATDLIVRITENTPMVMILMILYYIILGNSDISGMWVAVIGFTIVFAGAVIDLLKMGVGAVDRGQREAALALGYTENGAFMRMILPQAAYHFLPGFKSAVVRIIKETAIVGYIAVQDLTKVSDIIRSRTYEAFFPLVVSAVIYFFIALFFSFVINHIEIRLDPRSRKPENILKGVKTDD